MRRTLTICWILISISRCLAAAEPAPAAAKSSASLPARSTPWTTSRLTGTPEPPPPYRTTPAFARLAFERPVEMVPQPGSDWLLVLEQKGVLKAFHNRAEVSETTTVVDLTPTHPAINAYGFAFDPRFAENRFCYLAYALKGAQPDGTHVSRFRLTSLDPPQIDPASEQIMLTWLGGGHNGCCLQFGPDGMLYISSGDGSSPFPADVHDTGQNLDDLLSCVLRIDVHHAEGERLYSIPQDNPFVDRAGARGEIWAYGFRNPWKMSFDRTGALWVGDVGWEMFEMVYRVERGGNYGWSVTEGTQPVHGERKRGPTPILPPTIEHNHVESRSLTGGYVYYGKRLPELYGAYVYGDYVTGKLWAVRHDGREVTWRQELGESPHAIVAFGLDQAGELYIVDYAGTLHQLEPNPAARTANSQFPTRLSETGLFASTADNTPVQGVVPYRINAEAWNDGAKAERWLALPGDSQLSVYQNTNVQIGHIRGEWRFPPDGVLAKTIALELTPGEARSRRRIETQLLHYDGRNWRAYSYVWNDEQTDATLAPAEGLDRVLTIADSKSPGGQRQRTWHVAARNECIICHTTRAGSLHAFNPSQLAHGEQLAAFTNLGLFEQPPAARKPIVDPYDTTGDLDARARAYLHLNCAHCHCRGGGGTAAFDARLELKLDKMALVGSRPTQGTFGIHSPQVVCAGDPTRSVLFYRMAKLGRGRMPHFGSQVVDDKGLALVGQWIEGLGPRAAVPVELQSLLAENATSAAVKPLIEKLLSTTTGAIALLQAINAGQLTEPLRQVAIDAALAQPEVAVRDLFERFTPEDQRSRQLVSAVKSTDILALAGNAENGRKLFFETAGVSCRNCHKLRGQGGEVGPDLSELLPKRSRAQVLESILEPSKSIEPKFTSYLVETSQGTVHQGLLVAQTAEGVTLKDAQNRPIKIATADVETFVPQRTSLMPELLVRDWRPQQIADLIEFLMSK